MSRQCYIRGERENATAIRVSLTIREIGSWIILEACPRRRQPDFQKWSPRRSTRSELISKMARHQTLNPKKPIRNNDQRHRLIQANCPKSRPRLNHPYGWQQLQATSRPPQINLVSHLPNPLKRHRPPKQTHRQKIIIKNKRRHLTRCPLPKPVKNITRLN